MATKVTVDQKSEVLTSYKELKLVLEVCNIISPEFTNTPEAGKKVKRTPFELGIVSFITRVVKPVLEDYQNSIVSINNKHAKKDSEGYIVYDEKDRLIYKPEEDDKRRKAIKVLEEESITVAKYKMRDADAFPANISKDDEDLLKKFIEF